MHTAILKKLKDDWEANQVRHEEMRYDDARLVNPKVNDFSVHL